MKIVLSLLLATLVALPLNLTNAIANSPSPAVQTRDNWRSVRTNNLLVIGNADAEKLRQVAAWLEFFHSAFARLVSRNVLDASVPTTVILFRDEASFTPFKPLYQGRPANVAGFFQPGEDVNYIAISLDPSERDPFSTAFHEYVHLHLKDNVPGTPLWLNEGLAEFYGTMQFSGGEATLGAPLNHYIRLLREQEMLPLSTLLSIGTNSPHYNEQEKSGIFYGESWALVHYLMLGGSGNNRQEQFKRFLQQVSRGESAAKALEDSFGMSLATIEDQLKAYVRRGEFPALRIATADPEAYASYTAMQRSSLTEGEANYYLGDLLFHINREADAERYFKQAIALDANLLQAHAALGVIYTFQKRYADAKKHLQRATESQQSYLVHYLYAFVLSREGVSSTGRITDYSRETATLIRDNLVKSIKLAPTYAPSHYLLALVDLVTNERLDEALEMARKARQLAPDKASYALLLAQIHLRRSEAADARAILESLTRSSDTAVRAEAQSLLDSSTQTNTNAAANRGSRQVSGAMISEPTEKGSSPRMIGGSGGSVAIRDGQTIDTSASMPSVDEVLNRYVEAMGGAAAINKYTSRVMTGTLDVAGISRGGSFEQYAQAPNKFLMVMQAHPFGKMQMGFNGKSAWMLADAKVSPITGVDLAIMQRDADFYSPLRTKNNYAKVTLPGMSKIGYREVYVLDLQPTIGPLERLYLDSQTFLPVRMNTVRTMGRAGEPVEIYFDDWRDVDGVKYPFSISQNSPTVKLGFTVKEIRHNVPIDAKMFDSSRPK